MAEKKVGYLVLPLDHSKVVLMAARTADLSVLWPVRYI